MRQFFHLSNSSHGVRIVSGHFALAKFFGGGDEGTIAPASTFAYAVGKMRPAEKIGASFDLASLHVGALTFAGRALLAPMAGVTDAAMRRIAERFGASATVSEMVTAEGMARGDRETRLRLAGDGERRIVQIAARDPLGIADAVRYAENSGAQLIDINMGCPCKRVTGGLAGSALMRDVDLAASLVAAAVRAATVPVSVKMRLGWDDSSRNAAEVARRVELEGAAMVTVHGRTRAQFYSGAADWAAIAEVKQAVRIPVVANGDCASPEDAREMLRLSGADAVMVGRAALGRPWLIGDIASYLSTGRRRPPPSLAARRDAALEHFEGLLSAMGEGAGLRHARKHLAAYVDGAGCALTSDGAELRRALVTATAAHEVRRLLERLFSSHLEEEAA
jgi:tRNA-dihydrouridine synthase B